MDSLNNHMHPLTLIKEGFFYLKKKGAWKLVIHRGLQIESKQTQELLIAQAHQNTGHSGLHKTYSELPLYYHWQNIYSDTIKYIHSCEIYQLTKGKTQKPFGLLTPLNIPVLPRTSIAMDFLYMEPVVVDCALLIPGFKNLHRDKPHMIQFHKLLVISNTLSNFTFLIPCISEIIVENVISIFENWIKPAVGLPANIITY